MKKFLELLKWFINALPTLTQLHTRQKKMNTQRILNEEKVKEFVGDFSKHFKDLKAWTEDAMQIRTWREYFLKKYPEIFSDFLENEVEMDIEVATTMENKPAIYREKKLRKVEEKLLSKRTNEKFTSYDGVMYDPDLTLTQKIICLQKAIDDVTRRKIHWASLQGQLLEDCFLQSKKVYEKTLVETKIGRQWAQFLQKLHKLVLEYNQLAYCTVSLSYIRSNFKIIEEICECDKEKWK